MQYNKNNRDQFVGTILSVLQENVDSKIGGSGQVGASVDANDDDGCDDRVTRATRDHQQGREHSETKTRSDDDSNNHVRRSLTDWIAFCMVISMMVVASILFMLSVASSSVFSTVNHLNHLNENNNSNNINNNTKSNSNSNNQQRGNYGGGQLSGLPGRAAKNDNSLYKCELSYWQMDKSLIKFSIDHLIVANEGESMNEGELERPNGNQLGGAQQVSGKDERIRRPATAGNPLDKAPFRFDSIDYNSTVDELLANTRLDPKLPFVFFINGFNTLKGDGEISDTWMFDVAKSVALDSLERSSRLLDALDAERDKQQAKTMLLTRLFNRLMVGFSRSRQSTDKRPSASGVSSNLRANVIFLTWSIPHIFADNMLAMVPAYYKTVANYELIVGFVADTITKTVRFVERARSAVEAHSTSAEVSGQAVEGARQLGGWSSPEERLQYFRGFEFYGHSLGSHILSDAIRQVRLALGPGVKFGKLTGLDPATPCFWSVEHGISMSKVSSSIDELVVVHSNAGLAGLTSDRADTEIVLNGGTFQPGCRWYDFACHHSRSTAILRYRDNECQMVAYKCPSYHHFKTGACETCDQPAPAFGGAYDLFQRPSSNTGKIQQHQNHTIDLQELKASKNSIDQSSNKGTNQSQEAPGPLVKNCVLVNLPEQHLDSERVVQFAEYNNQIRQLADNNEDDHVDGAHAKGKQGDVPRDRRKPVPSWRRRDSPRRPDRRSSRANLRRADDERAKKAYYHYVNTSPNFRSGRKSHCLQHYQLRLIMYHKNGDDKRIEQRCRPSGYTLNSDEPEIRLGLLYEPEPMRKMATVGGYDSSSKRLLLLEGGNRKAAQAGAEKVKLSGRGAADRVGSNTIALDAIIKDMLHTTLLTIEREPKLFVGALVDNIELGKLIDCYVRENATSGPHFVLDVAFMSHTNYKIRNAYSSVLCGQLDLKSRSNKKSTSELSARDAALLGPGQIQSGYKNRPSGGTKNTRSGDTIATGDDQLQLLLSLCKQSDLMDVSAEIDKLLNHIELHRLDDSWKVSLLNNLFSLFAEWEPF